MLRHEIGMEIFLYPFHQVSLRIKDEPKASNTFNECLMAVASILGAASYSIYLIHAKLFLISSVFTRTIFLPDWFRDLSGMLAPLWDVWFLFPFRKAFSAYVSP
jgi:hypothetical protein